MAANIAIILKRAYLELRSLVSVAWQQASDGVFLLRAGLCCPGCRGWRRKGSTWRSPAGSSTRRSLPRSAITVSTSPRSIILFILVSICTRLCAVSLLFCLYFILMFFPCSLFCLYPSTFLTYDSSLPQSHFPWFLVFDWSSTSVSACFLSSDAEVHLVNMTALTKGHLLSSFWVVDKRHFYIGSASMDWRSLATVFQTHHTS